jgi:hypothetical protein
MRVSTRLYLAVVPAILGVVVLAALAYWTERGRQAPEVLVAIVILASLASVVIAWRNARYVAQRIEQLAQSRVGHSLATGMRAERLTPADELDQIEATVTGLSDRLSVERAAGERRVRAAEASATESREMLREAVAGMSARLDEAHLPLHVLISSPFGELNENQEELLTAAQQTMESADMELRQLRKLIEVESGEITLVPRPIALTELLGPPLAIARSRASASVVSLITRIPDDLPRAIVDPVHTQEALTALLCDVILRVPAGDDVTVHASEIGRARLEMTVSPSVPALNDQLAVRLARRVIEREGGRVMDQDGKRQIHLPSER